MAETYAVAASKPVFIVENSDWVNVTEFLKVWGCAPYRIEPENDRFVPFYGPSINTLYIAHGFNRGLIPV